MGAPTALEAFSLRSASAQDEGEAANFAATEDHDVKPPRRRENDRRLRNSPARLSGSRRRSLYCRRQSGHSRAG